MTDPSATVESPLRLTAFAALGAAQAAIYLALSTWQGYHTAPGLVLALAGFVFVLYLGALGAARPLAGGRALVVALVLGLIFRGVLIPEPPFLSDDYFRYLWDGVVQLRGINPYRYAPADPTLAGIDDALRAQVNHPQVRTIYAPAAQFGFALNATLGGGWLGLKLLWLICDAAIAALIYRLVPRQRRLQLWTLYWWSPLVVLEVAWNAHLDLLGILPVVAAIWLSRRQAPRFAGLAAAIAAATLVKYFPAALLPAAARRGHAVRIVAVFVTCLALVYAPYLDAGRHLFSGLVTYAGAWRFNDGVFALLVQATGSIVAAKVAAATAIACLITQCVRRHWAFERAVFWITGAVLVLSPTLHPWYVLWMVPLIAIRPNPAWLYLSGSVLAAYYGLGTYRSEGTWPEPWWVRTVVYGPFFILLARDAWHDPSWRAAWERMLRRR